MQYDDTEDEDEEEQQSGEQPNQRFKDIVRGQSQVGLFSCKSI